MEWWKFLILIVGSYLLGNIFFARIISKIKKYDINELKRINMKKYVKVAFVAAITAVAGYNVY